MELLRDDLLKGRRIVVSGEVPDELRRTLLETGAEVEDLRLDGLGSNEEQVGEWARARRPLHGIVHAAGAAFGSGGEAALSTTLDQAWAAVREVAVGALIDAEAGAKLVLLAPRPNAGPLAEAARAGLENLARTLSVEWARHGLTSVVVAPGASTTEAEIAALASFLVSEAGGYLSGCRLSLGEVT